jgi:hypothetical protein
LRRSLKQTLTAKRRKYNNRTRSSVNEVACDAPKNQAAQRTPTLTTEDNRICIHVFSQSQDFVFRHSVTNDAPDWYETVRSSLREGVEFFSCPAMDFCSEAALRRRVQESLGVHPVHNVQEDD